VPLSAGEHTAQVPAQVRKELEETFKSKAPSTLNVLACSPTLEMGIDVGGLNSSNTRPKRSYAASV
jgi:Lhr-like helicase